MRKEVVKTEDFNLVKQIYSNCNYDTKGIHKNEGDQYFVGLVNDKPVGVVRLCVEHGFQIMRGLVVQEGFQKRGLGGMLIKKVVEESHRRHSIWCLCHPLVLGTGLYERQGFMLQPHFSTPAVLENRQKMYEQKGWHTMIMVRKPQP